jgi:GNAT superfamily N-acetyltransferase
MGRDAPAYTIRRAALDDVGFLADVSVAATRDQGRLPNDFDEPEWRAGFAEWTAEQIRDEGSPSTTSVIEVDGEPVGRLRVSRTAEGIELCGIQLLPRVQNRGIGTAIITALQAEAADLGVPLELGVEKDNLNAHRLYNLLGFTKYAESPEEHKLRWTSPTS